MSRFILTKLSSRNEFRTNIKCDILRTNIQYANLKIDTGAMRTLLPLRTINFHSNFEMSGYSSVDGFYYEYKKELQHKGFKITHMRGVANVKEYPVNMNEIDRDDVVFTCPINNLYIDDYYIPDDHEIGISCDTSGNVLLGMDILKDFDYHCGESLISDSDSNINNGDHIFIACLKTDLNEDYLMALKRYLGYIPDYKRLEFLIRNKNIQLESKFVERNYDKGQIGI